MPESNFRRIIREFLEEMETDVVEERVVNYIVRGLQEGRKLKDVLDDPYVRNRLTEERIERVIENKEIIETVEKELTEAFEKEEFGFSF